MIAEALRLRDFRRVFLAQVISTIGDFFVPVAISFGGARAGPTQA